jgi:hypothetical protein
MDRLRATVYDAADLAAAARVAFGGDDNGGSGPSTSDKMCNTSTDRLDIDSSTDRRPKGREVPGAN